jgi:hypothetical protein
MKAEIKIKLTIKDQEFELTFDEVKELKNALEAIFPSMETTIYKYQSEPYQTPRVTEDILEVRTPAVYDAPPPYYKFNYPA